MERNRASKELLSWLFEFVEQGVGSSRAIAGESVEVPECEVALRRLAVAGLESRGKPTRRMEVRWSGMTCLCVAGCRVPARYGSFYL